MVLFEEVAAPPLLLIHVFFFVLGAVVWFAGFVMMLAAFKQKRLQELATKVNKVLFLGGSLLAIGFVGGSLLYPVMRLEVIGGALGFHATQPFFSLLFTIKQWVAAVGALAVVGSIAFNSGSKKGALISLFLCIVVLITIIVDTIIAIIITAWSAL